MNSTTFDTYSFVKKLKNDGMSEQQAETIVNAIQSVRELDKDSFATKYDIKEVEHKMDKVEHRITNKMGGMLIALAAFLTAIKFLG
jgi:hypothetical protein